MIIHCEKELLLTHAQLLSRMVSTRTTLPILECILLEVTKSGFKMTTNDLEMAVETKSIEAVVEEEGMVAIEGKMFFEIIRRLPDGIVTLWSDATNMVTIKCASSEFKIMGMSGMEFPVLPTVEKENGLTVSCGALKNMIRKTLFAVSTDETKPAMMGELFEIRDGFFHLVAVDGFRVAYCRQEATEGSKDSKVIMPARSMGELGKLLPQEMDATVTIYSYDRYAMAEVEGYTFITRIINGEFIKYSQLFETEYTTLVTIDKQRFQEGLERAALLATKDIKKSPVQLKIGDDVLTISTKTEIGNVVDDMVVSTEGNALDIAFNPRYLLEAIRAMDAKTLTLQLTTNLSPCIIKNAEEECGTEMHLVLPLRLNV